MKLKKKRNINKKKFNLYNIKINFILYKLKEGGESYGK